MIGRLAALILLRTVSLVQTAEAPQQISLTVAEVGGNVTFQCPVSERESKFFYWHKQSLGFMVQTIAAHVQGKFTITEQFKDSRFTVTKEKGQYFLTIRNVSKEDEATYFCQNAGTYAQSFVKGIFLAVKERHQKKSVNVKQRPETASVQPGSSVTLQCSPSKNKENRVLCPGEHSVYWFRTGSGGFHPGVIYTQRNSSDGEEERSCVYSWSKTIQNSSDTGTYDCAVVETKTVSDSGSELDPVVLVLGVLLACCATVIAVLILYVNRRKVCEHCKGTMSASHHLGHEKSTVHQSNDLGDEAKEVNYAALDFSTRKVKKGKKKRESPQESVYSDVRADHHNQHSPSV